MTHDEVQDYLRSMSDDTLRKEIETANEAMYAEFREDDPEAHVPALCALNLFCTELNRRGLKREVQ